jgi:Mrp family chromosome partitioning ATPase
MKLVPFIDGLCVRAEAAGRTGEPLRILVTGSRAGAGTSVLAQAIANRFSVSGANVLLIDANPRNPEISRSFVEEGSGLAGFLAGTTSGTHLSPRLTVVGLTGPADAEELRRQRVEPLIHQASRQADVVVIDAGAMQNSVSTAHMMRLVDAVVLAMPMTRQRVDELNAVARQLDLFDTEVIAVTAPVGRRRRRPVPLVPPPSPDQDQHGDHAPPSGGIEHVPQPALSFAAPAAPASAGVRRTKTPSPKPTAPR